MIKKIFSIVLLSLILSHCGYTPIYSPKSLNFKIDKIKTIGDQKVGNYLLKKLKIFNKDDNNKKKYDLIINSKIDKNISSKDKKNFSNSDDSFSEDFLRAKKSLLSGR